MQTSSPDRIASKYLYQSSLTYICERAGLAVQMFLELLAELLHESKNGHSRSIAQRAEGPAHHILRKVLNVVDVFGLAESCVEAGQRLLEPVRSLAAGDAPAAAFVLIKANR